MSDTIEPDWKAKWGPALEAVGQDFSDGRITWGADAIEAGLVRRYVEPLELGSPIHHDAEAAKAMGYEGVVAPATSLLSFSKPPMWTPGDAPLFEDPSRDAQPERSPLVNNDAGPVPRTHGYFATNIELEFRRPVVAGERVGSRGRRLQSCVLKETSVGRGAFIVYRSEILSDRGDLVAELFMEYFIYDPVPVAGDAR